MALITCPSCGKLMEGKEAFCPYCGASTKNAAGAPSAQPNPTVQEKSYAPPIYTPPVNQSYAPPVYPQQPPVQSYDFSGKTGKGMGWIVFMRVILWIIFAAIIIVGIGRGIEYFDYNAGVALVQILTSILMAFIVVAGGMIALNNATNLRSIAMNTAKTVELLQELKKK